MPLNLRAHLHAFLGSFGQPSEHQELVSLYRDAEAWFDAARVYSETDKDRFIETIVTRVADGLVGILDDPEKVTTTLKLVHGLVDYEGFFTLPHLDATHPLSTARTWELREVVERQLTLAQDLEAVSREERSVVVLDSQGDLIRNISNLAVFAPGGDLHERIVIIDPTDVEYPVSQSV